MSGLTSMVGGGSFLSNIGPIFSAVSSIMGAFGGSEKDTPALPAPPAPAPLPPAPVASTAPVAPQAPVIDAEAARLRAQKRRAASTERTLFELNSEDPNILTKSILGESE